MSQRVFVNVIGFSDVERHALNTVFRLSEQRDTAYAPWTPETDAAKLILMDGDCYEALLAMASPGQPDVKLIWIGNGAPAYTWRSFDRPLHWPDVIAAMDELFSPPEALDFDLDADFDGSPPDTRPPGDDEGEAPKRALIASANLDERLYLRARLALSGLTLADDAETAAQALELAGTGRYSVVLVDFALPQGGWNLLKLLRGLKPALPHLLVTKSRPTRTERLRARLSGVQGFFDKPPHPAKLRNLLQKV
jgi:hypothetical protein